MALLNLQEITYDKESINNRLVDRLINNRIEYEKLFQVLKDNRAYLSGSFLLQTIGNYYFDEFSVDILIFNKKKDELFESQITSLFTNYLEFGNFHKLTYDECGKEDISYLGYSSYSFEGITRIATLTAYSTHISMDYSAKRKVNIIYIDTEKYSDIASYVNSLDLDICSNYYDGKNDLYIKNLDSIINKIAKYNGSDDFTIKNYNLKRIDKYSKRGFSIELDFNNNIYALINNYNKEKLNKKDIKNDVKNVKVAIIGAGNGERIIGNLPSNIENILIYRYNYYDPNPNFNNVNYPYSLKEIRYFGIKSYKGEPELPNGCELYINNIRKL